MLRRVDRPSFFEDFEKRLTIGWRGFLFQIAVEFFCILLVFIRAGNWEMGPMAIAISLIMMLGQLVIALKGSNSILYITGTLLMTFGFVVQMISIGRTDLSHDIWRSIFGKLGVAFVVFLFTFILIDFGKTLLMNYMIPVGLQALMLMALFLGGSLTESKYGQDALLELNIGRFGFQPLEIIKILYIFVIARFLYGQPSEVIISWTEKLKKRISGRIGKITLKKIALIAVLTACITFSLIMLGSFMINKLPKEKAALVKGHRLLIFIAFIAAVFVLVIDFFYQEIEAAAAKKLPEKISGCVKWIPTGIFVVYTGAVIFVMARFFKELGSGFMIFAVFAALMTVFYRNRKTIKYGWILCIILGAAGIIGIVFLVLRKTNNPFILKIYFRLVTFLHPEDYQESIQILNYYVPGYHGVRINEAITTGGLWGPFSNRYIVPLSAETNDMVFTKIVQCMGVVSGIMVIFLYISFLLCIAGIYLKEKEMYWKIVIMGILAMFGIEALWNIGAASGCMPIMGIPLYLVSQGFTALTMGFFMLAVLLAVSARATNRRDWLYEFSIKKFEWIGGFFRRVRKRFFKEKKGGPYRKVR